MAWAVIPYLYFPASGVTMLLDELLDPYFQKNDWFANAFGIGSFVVGGTHWYWFVGWGIWKAFEIVKAGKHPK